MQVLVHVGTHWLPLHAWFAGQLPGGDHASQPSACFSHTWICAPTHCCDPVAHASVHPLDELVPPIAVVDELDAPPVPDPLLLPQPAAAITNAAAANANQ